MEGEIGISAGASEQKKKTSFEQKKKSAHYIHIIICTFTPCGTKEFRVVLCNNNNIIIPVALSPLRLSGRGAARESQQIVIFGTLTGSFCSRIRCVHVEKGASSIMFYVNYYFTFKRIKHYSLKIFMS